MTRSADPASAAGLHGERVALVHDYLLVLRGAERCVAEMSAIWPHAPLMTLLYDEAGTRGRFSDRTVITSRLQRLGVSQRSFRRMLPLFPPAAERLPVHHADLVVSSSSAFAHGVRPREDAVHVCYCYTPFRYAWFERDRALSEMPRPLRPLLDAELQRFRRWDLAASRRVTHYVGISELSQRRIAEIYGREAGLVHPPVEVDRFAPAPKGPEDFLLVVCEIVRHKRVDVTLRAAARAGRSVKVVGTGPDLERLRAEFSSTVDFLGRVDDDALAQLYPRALALVMPNVEEFGITAVEAQAAGRPVVAADAGGARETVIDGVTGVLVPEGDEDALAQALRDTHFDRFEPEACIANAQRFSPAVFRAALEAEVQHARRRRR